MSDSENTNNNEFMTLLQDEYEDECVDFTNENGWGVWLSDNSEKFKQSGYVILGASVASVGGYFLFKHYYSNNE